MLVEGFATQGSVDDHSLRINEKVIGDGIDLVGYGGSTIETFQVGKLHPRHFDMSDSLHPCLLLLIQGNADDLNEGTSN